MSTNDVDVVAGAIAAAGAPRRAVATGAAWSVPVIATAIAAPRAAASPTCEGCTASGRPPMCILAGSPGGTCQCAAGLTCVGTGPLNLANLCVGTNVISQTCGGSTCFGVCVGSGGLVPSALATLTTALSALVAAARVAGATACVKSVALPSNLCASATNDGGLGALCSRSSTCGSNIAVNALLATVVTAYNALISAFGALGLVAVSECQPGFVCRPLVDVGVSLNPLGTLLDFGLQLQLGFCQCPDGSTTCRQDLPSPCTLTP